MFHDTPVTRILLRPNSVIFETDEFAVSETEVLRPGRIEITEIGTVFRNDEAIGSFAIHQDDVEIHSLRCDKDGVDLVLIWHCYTPTHSEDLAVYKFPGATLHIKAIGGGLLEPVVDPDSDCMR